MTVIVDARRFFGLLATTHMFVLLSLLSTQVSCILQEESRLFSLHPLPNHLHQGTSKSPACTALTHGLSRYRQLCTTGNMRSALSSLHSVQFSLQCLVYVYDYVFAMN